MFTTTSSHRVLLFDMQPHTMGPMQDFILRLLDTPPWVLSVTEDPEEVLQLAPSMDALVVRHSDGLAIQSFLKAFRPIIAQRLVLVLTLHIKHLQGFLEVGASEVLSETLPPVELQQRLQLLLIPNVAGNRLVRGPLTLHLSSSMVQLNGLHILLTHKEMALLHHLASHPGVLHTRERLSEHLWGESFHQQKIGVLVFSLRRKLGGQFIQAVRGQGYAFEV